jgi:hypothetical protein
VGSTGILESVIEGVGVETYTAPGGVLGGGGVAVIVFEEGDSTNNLEIGSVVFMITLYVLPGCTGTLMEDGVGDGIVIHVVPPSIEYVTVFVGSVGIFVICIVELVVLYVITGAGGVADTAAPGTAAWDVICNSV